MTTNINQLLFSRMAPQKKLDVIENINLPELWTTPETITRIVKEAGERIGKSRNKRLYISRNRQRGNNWNSTVVAVELLKGILYLDIYFQMDSTDTNLSIPFSTFFSKSEYRGKYITTNRYGDSEPHYFRYEEDDKKKVLQSILLEYVYTKYESKLKDNESQENN
jgi:hypothetical protein